VSFYAGKHGISPEKVLLMHVWRYFRNLECAELIEIVRKSMCMNFGAVHFHRDFKQLTYVEIESIISEDKYLEDVYEEYVLQSLIRWARHQSMQAQTLRKGDLVQLRSDCTEHSDLLRRDCLVKNVNGNTLTIQCMCSRSAQLFEVDKQHVYDAGQYAFIKLLRHVRIGSMRISILNIFLDLGDLRYVNKIPEFRESLKRMIDVQIGKSRANILGAQARPRKTCTKYGGAATSEDITELLWKVMDEAEKEADGLVRKRNEHEKKIKELVDKCDQQQQVIDNFNTEPSQTHSQTSQRPVDPLQLLIAPMTPEQLEALAAEKRRAMVLACSASSTGSTDHAAEASASATRGSKRKQVSQKAEGQASKRQKKPSHVTKGN
jgi:hypothetical protein